MVPERERVHLLFPKTVSWSKAKRLKNVPFILIEARVLAEPTLWEEVVGKGKV
jgi:hypothetical protein